MGGDRRPLPTSTSKIQEAIDTIVQSFAHPEAISLSYRFEDGEKRTKIEIRSDDDITTYELVYDGQDDEAEPKLTRQDESEQSTNPSK